MLVCSFNELFLFFLVIQGARTNGHGQEGCRDLEVPVQGSGALSSRWKLICVMLSEDDRVLSPFIVSLINLYMQSFHGRHLKH